MWTHCGSLALNNNPPLDARRGGEDLALLALLALLLVDQKGFFDTRYSVQLCAPLIQLLAGSHFLSSISLASEPNIVLASLSNIIYDLS